MRSAPVLLLLALAACQTMPAVDTGYTLRPDTRPECARRCDELGMRLSAIVLIRNSAGCVCEARGAAPEATGAPRAALSGGSAVAAGGALVVAREEEAAAEERRRREDARRRDEEARRRREDEARRRATEQRPGTAPGL